MRAQQLSLPPVKYDAFRLEGGLDLVTPTLALKPGVARDAQNFEISLTGGYTRINGVERFDGRAAPSAATWGVITLSAVAGLAVGNTFTDGPAAKTASCIALDANNNVVFTNTTGASFVVGDTIKVGAGVIGTIVATTNFTPSALTQATYTSLAADVYRALIGQVPGAGPVRGVVYFNGTVYAWRNNVGQTAMAIYKSSASGWQAVTLGFELAFTGGLSTIPAEGATLTGATSGATATIQRIALSSGTTWIGGSGRFVVTPLAGTFSAAENLQVAGVVKAVAGGAATAIALAPGGRVQFVQGSFGNNTGVRVYGCDNVNRGFEFDGTVYVPITTGMTTDKPTNVAAHKNFLFFSFANSVQNSGIGTPYVWSPVFGANEFVLPENVTGLLTLPGTVQSGALAVFTRNNTYLLYGYSVSSFNLVPYNQGVGGNSYTPQNIDNAYALDDRGVISMATTLNFGNFDSSTLTFPLRPFIAARRSLATASAVNREKSQYRVFYSDGYGLYVTIVNGQTKGAMPVVFPDPVFCWSESQPGNATETSYYGGTNTGYVYTLDSGTSFDGANISAYFTLNYNNEGSARILKRYRRASLEMQGSGYADFQFGYSLAYGSSDIDQAGASTTYASPFVPANWDTFVWDNFIWDGRSLLPNEVECIGTGENIAVTVSTNSKINMSFTINSITLHYTPRRGIR